MTWQEIKSEIASLYKADFTVHALILTTLLFVGMFATGCPVLGFLFFLVGFSVFDVIGFNISTYEIPEPYFQNKTFKYRIIQCMMQVFMTALIAKCCGPWYAIPCTIAWWLTACDKMFYIISKSSYSGTYPWLESWSIFAITKQVGMHADDRTFNTLAVLGTIIGIALSFAF